MSRSSLCRRWNETREDEGQPSPERAGCPGGKAGESGRLNGFSGHRRSSWHQVRGATGPAFGIRKTDPQADSRSRQQADFSGFSRLVGARGFEPPTPCSRSRCATRLRYAPTVGGDYPPPPALARGTSSDNAPQPSFGANRFSQVPMRGIVPTSSRERFSSTGRLRDTSGVPSRSTI